MNSGWLAPIRYIWQACTRENSPRQIALGIALGMVVGLVPKGNLTAACLGILLAATKLNLGSGLLSAAVFSWLSPRGDAVFHGFGSRLLTHPQLYPHWESLHQQPLVPWFSWNNTVVLGSLISGVALFYPVYRIALGAALWMQPHVQRWRHRSSAGHGPAVDSISSNVASTGAELADHAGSLPQVVTPAAASPDRLQTGMMQSGLAAAEIGFSGMAPPSQASSGHTSIAPGHAGGPAPAPQPLAAVTGSAAPAFTSSAAGYEAISTEIPATRLDSSTQRPRTLASPGLTPVNQPPIQNPTAHPQMHVATVLPTATLPMTVLPTTIHVSRHLDAPFVEAPSRFPSPTSSAKELLPEVPAEPRRTGKDAA